MSVILHDDVVREAGSDPFLILVVPGVGEFCKQLDPWRRDGIDRCPARPRLALGSACVVRVEQDRGAEPPELIDLEQRDVFDFEATLRRCHIRYRT